MSSRASVTVTSQPLWRIRVNRGFSRYVLYALAVWGILASARFAIAPPRAVIPKTPRVQPADLAAEGFASQFARHYLTWNAEDPQAYERELEPYLGTGFGASTGMQLPGKGSQHVRWVEVVQAREAQSGEHVYTVAAETTSAGLLYLTVSVIRQSGGSLALAGYPAFVGAPNSARMDNVIEHYTEVQQPALSTVVDRALTNYLSASASELAADLTSEAQVSLPGMPLALQSVQELRWLPDRQSVFAVVVASDHRGATYTLTYELDVAFTQGRWEISAIQMNPDT